MRSFRAGSDRSRQVRERSPIRRWKTKGLAAAGPFGFSLGGPSYEKGSAQVPGHRVPNTRVLGFSDKKGLLSFIASLRHGGNRRESGLFFVEGAKMVRKLASRAPIEAIVVCPELCLITTSLLLRSTPGLVTVEVGRRRYENAARHFAIKQDPRDRGFGAQTWVGAESFVPPPRA